MNVISLLYYGRQYFNKYLTGFRKTVMNSIPLGVAIYSYVVPRSWAVPICQSLWICGMGNSLI